MKKNKNNLIDSISLITFGSIILCTCVSLLIIHCTSAENEWIDFWGSIAGGALTFLGVSFTILSQIISEKKKQDYDTCPILFAEMSDETLFFSFELYDNTVDWFGFKSSIVIKSLANTYATDIKLIKYETLLNSINRNTGKEADIGPRLSIDKMLKTNYITEKNPLKFECSLDYDCSLKEPTKCDFNQKIWISFKNIYAREYILIIEYTMDFVISPLGENIDGSLIQCGYVRKDEVLINNNDYEGKHAKPIVYMKPRNIKSNIIIDEDEISKILKEKNNK